MGKENFARGFNGATEEETIAAESGVTDQEMPEAGVTGQEDLIVQEGTDTAGLISPEIPPEQGELMAEGVDVGAAGDAGLEVMPDAEPEMNQSEKSWNGRLTAREAEIKARAEELERREAEVAQREAILPMDYQEAVAFLTDQFGDEFVSAVAAVAIGAGKGAAETSTADLMGKIDSVTTGIRDAFGTLHNEMISTAHEDFEEIAQSDQFKEYIDGLADDDKAAAMMVIEEGSSRQVIKLLTAFKKALETIKPDDKYDTDALDAAAGVRSAGGRAPSLAGDAIAAGGEVDRFRAGFNA